MNKQLRRCLPLILFCFIFCISPCVQAQVKDSTRIGSIKGWVHDSAYNFVLSSATIAVYKTADSSLLQYSLPNNFGEFTIAALPVETSLRVIISHVGYKPLVRKFDIAKSSPQYDFGKLSLQRKKEEDSLAEVTVTAVVPVRMNGDTLEFNADAFKLDKNATAEDLMRRLPGFMIWDDGEITVNGRKVNSVLVNGKPFMGGNAAVATQNLSKDALQKVQVYSQVTEDNPMDSTTHVNLKLKEDKNTGYFGKVSGGYGTDSRFAADAMMGGFNKKLQWNLVGAANNVNKVAGGTDQLIRSSSYKGVGASVDYQPDFRMGGLNRPVAAGFNLQYDFVANPQYNKTERLSSNAFFSRNNTEVLRNTTSQSFLGKDSVLTQSTQSKQSGLRTSQSLSANYQKNTSQFFMTSIAYLRVNDDHSINESSSEQERTHWGQVSTNYSRNESNRQSKNLDMNFTLQHYNSGGKRTNFFQMFNVEYGLNLVDNSGSSLNNTRFRSMVNPAANRDYSRFYEKQDGASIRNRVNLSYTDLKKLLFGEKRVWDIGMRISTDVYVTNGRYKERVLDFDTLTKQNKLNTYLTNNRTQNIFNVLPSLNLSKGFWNHLSDRYSKNVSININLTGQHYAIWHEASQQVQNFERVYNRFVPNANLSIYNDRYGRFSTNQSIGYSASAEYPQLQHIAPLVDSANALYVPMGNALIRPEYLQSIYYNASYSSKKPNKPLELSFSLNAGKYDHKISDSSFYDNSGSRLSYYVNMSGYRFADGNASIRKSVKIKKQHTLQGALRGNYGLRNTPSYLDNIRIASKDRNGGSSLEISYGYKDVVSLRLEEKYGFNRSEQQGNGKQGAENNSVFTSNNWSTQLSGAVQWPKNLTWASHATFNNYTMRQQSPVKFTIWNAHLTYRFLKGNRGEVKLAALDLLRQNKSVTSYAGYNTQTFGYTNVLQQYYMLTLSYYPRKFGR